MSYVYMVPCLLPAADGNKYNNKCLAECAKTTAAGQPDASGNCPKAAAAAPKAQSGTLANGATCRCARNYKPVCGSGACLPLQRIVLVAATQHSDSQRTIRKSSKVRP